MGHGPSSSWAKYGCLSAVGLAAVVTIVLGLASVVAVRQNRAAAFEHQDYVQEIPDTARTVEPSPRPVRLRLEVHTAGLSVKPIAPGESIRIDADYDPRLFVLRQESRQEGGGVLLNIGLRPLGSTLMALLRVKLGGRPAMLHVALPRDVRLEIEGDLQRSFAAMELGGLSLTSTKLDVTEGGVKLSFFEPMPVPMESLRIFGSRGSLSVVGLGNASPRTTRLLQHIGALDIDLRGSWAGDAEVEVIGGAAGGSLWLPDNVTILGLDERRGIRLDADPELPRPTIDLMVSEHMGRIVVID